MAVVATAALVLGLTILAAPPAVARPDIGRLTLPAPTGPYAVGRDTLHLVDHARPDPWVPEAGPAS